jgi:hypothetical protein
MMSVMKTLWVIGLIAGTFFSLKSDASDGKRSTSINFEDEMIEGINRKPLDSVNQISERDGRGKQHLYRKRAGFSDRDLVLTQELRLQK